MKAGADICVTVTLLDGLVLARSVFHHSMNYRSVVLFGRTQVTSSACLDEHDNALLLLSASSRAGQCGLDAVPPPLPFPQLNPFSGLGCRWSIQGRP